MLHPHYPIETDRLLLRPLAATDLDDVYAYESSEDVARYLYHEARSRAQTVETLERNIRRSALAAEGDSLVLAAVRKEVGRVVGQVTLRWLSQKHRQGEIGFVFNPDSHGHGLATEAARVMLRLGFDDLRLHRIIGRCDARNRPSARLMERLGMRREAHLVESEFVKDEWTSEFVYAMLASEWRAQG